MSSRPFLRGRSEEGRRLARAELRPEDVPATPVSLRRVGRLFAPYRVRLGGLSFEGLKMGAWRDLTKAEVNDLRKRAGLA